MALGQWQQQFHVGSPPSGFQPGQGAYRGAGGGSEFGERGLDLLAQCSQPRADCGHQFVEVLVRLTPSGGHPDVGLGPASEDALMGAKRKSYTPQYRQQAADLVTGSSGGVEGSAGGRGSRHYPALRCASKVSI